MNEPKQLTATMANLERPVRVYFFERSDGSTFHVDEKAAWTLYSRGQQTLSGVVRYKYLGTSDGMKYAQAVQEANSIFRESGLEAAQDHLRKALAIELESARTNVNPPPNFDEIDKNGRPTRIANL